MREGTVELAVLLREKHLGWGQRDMSMYMSGREQPMPLMFILRSVLANFYRALLRRPVLDALALLEDEHAREEMQQRQEAMRDRDERGVSELLAEDGVEARAHLLLHACTR